MAEAGIARHPSTEGRLSIVPGAWEIDLNLNIDGPTAAAFLALAGVLLGLWVSGDRSERQRKRDLHARALAAIIYYGEMPFMVRRRRCEEAEQSAERVRLSGHFSEVKAEVSTCQVLLAADGDEKLRSAYDELVEEAKRTAGGEAHTAWTEPAVTTDAEMNMGGIFESLAPFRTQLDVFKDDLARSTLPRRKRLRHRGR